jgi:AmiR/NasT family two-component response regulator
MEDEFKSWQTTADKRSIINSAINHLSIRYKLPPEKAQEWILQEAMAKKATLDQVAEAVLCDKPVEYRYSAPV